MPARRTAAGVLAVPAGGEAAAAAVALLELLSLRLEGVELDLAIAST